MSFPDRLRIINYTNYLLSVIITVSTSCTYFFSEKLENFLRFAFETAENDQKMRHFLIKPKITIKLKQLNCRVQIVLT